MRKGVINPIDLAALVGVAAFFGVGIHFYQLMRQPLPRLSSVEPISVRRAEAAWLTLKGSQFRYARVAMVTNRVLVPLEVKDDSLRVYFDPQALDLMPDRYDMRVLNGWGRGHVLLDAITVLPVPRRPALTAQSQTFPTLTKPSVTPAPSAIETELPPPRGPRVWVTVEGWVRVEDGLVAGLMHCGDIAYDASGERVAEVLLTVKPIPSRQHAMYAVFEVHADQRDAYYYQAYPLTTGYQFLFTTPHYQAIVDLNTDVRPSLWSAYPLQTVELDLRVKGKALELVKQLAYPDALMNLRGVAVGKVVDRFVYSPDHSQDADILRVRIAATMKNGRLWAETARQLDPVHLKRGKKLRFMTQAGVFLGEIVNEIRVKQAP